MSVKKSEVLDYSYLDRISSDSTTLHLEVLEVFLEVGEDVNIKLKKIGALSKMGDLRDRMRKLYSNLRILGLSELVDEAEGIESLLVEGDTISPEEWSSNSSNFISKLEGALKEAKVDLERYRSMA